MITFELYFSEGKNWKFIIELFNKGNYIVVDEENKVKIARNYAKFKERDILANRAYQYPASSGVNILMVEKERFMSTLKESKEEIIRVLVRKIGLSGLYSEEICLRGNIDPNTYIKDLNNDDFELLYEAFRNLRNQLLFNGIHAQIIYNEKGDQIDVIPIELKIYVDFSKKHYPSFNEAVDDYFSKIDASEVIHPNDEKIKHKLETQQKILANQEDYLKELLEQKEKFYHIGEYIYENFSNLNQLINVISDARQKGFSYEEINLRLKQAKQEEMSELAIFKELEQQSRELIISYGNDEIKLKMSKTIGENASKYYDKGKKAEKKAIGTKNAIENTKKAIRKLEIEKDSIAKSLDFLVKKPKKKWYEKFHWFHTSDGLLVIGGRDASSNELIFKKYIQPEDLVLHTSFPGSPLTVIKNPDNLKVIPESSIREAADFVASFSRAWKENWGIIDVFYVDSSQISKSPPSGEYLPKGSFMITGKKNFVKDAKTELAIGLDLINLGQEEEGIGNVWFPRIICGPVSAIKHQANIFVKIKPSKSGLSAGKLAIKIKEKFLNLVDNSDKVWVNFLDVNEILLFLPSGLSNIKNK
jgi:predicted ribosome quality control (RQC) complex YloA/Tae2 family protein